MTFDDAIAALARCGRLRADDWPAAEPLDPYGLVAEDGWIRAAGGHDPLDPEQIRSALSPTAADWLRALSVHASIGSTNTELMARAETGGAAGCVCTAELQLQGRGRRGRDWSSPFGANLAVSLGVAVERPAAELGGASLVVGLAVVDALELMGVPGLALKWPNDVLRDGAKLCGILIELARTRHTELVIGIGLNVALTPALRDRLPQSVADLSDLPERPSRSDLLAGIVSQVVTFMTEFDRLGFDAFVEVFNARHHYHGRHCRVVRGGDCFDGQVTGVSSRGELMMRGAGEARTFNGGEVSLREAR